MNELSLFTGAGGGLLASKLLGINTVCAVERDEYCQHVLISRQNERVIEPFPIWDDICTFDGAAWRGTVDVVSGGFPCQAFSSAARGRNIKSKDLWGEMRRIIREVQPGVVFAENVAERAILQARIDLLEDGYSCVHKKVSAKDVGADHKRDRWWLLAYTDDYRKLCISINAEARMLQELRNDFWEADPRKFRAYDGVANRMDRLRATGNGQVPIVAATAWIELHNEMMKAA